MFAVYFGFILLIWFPGGLHARSPPPKSCEPPTLEGGYFVPNVEVYFHGGSLNYACDMQHKPVVEGWWARSTCENGKWVPEPQCIDVNACLPPNIPNASINGNSTSYKDAETISATCNAGYESIGSHTWATCSQGKWSSLPTCQKSTTSCSMPPEVQNAVVITGYQEVFPASTTLEYRCKEGYLTEDKQGSKSVSCSGGSWGQVPSCRNSTTSDENYRTIDDCGSPQNLPNTRYTVAKDRMSLTYKCLLRYSLTGSPTVRCNSDRTWSHLPTCRDCVAPLGQYARAYHLNENTVIEERETIELGCAWPGSTGRITCQDGWIQYTICCTKEQHRRRVCPAYYLQEPA